MQAVAANFTTRPCPMGPISAFLLGSFLAHLLILVLWTGAPPSGMPGGGVLQIDLAPGVSKAFDSDREAESSTTVPAAQSGDTVPQVVQEALRKAHIALLESQETRPKPDPAASRDQKASPRPDPVASRDQKALPVQGSAELRAKTRASVRVPDRRQASNRATTRSYRRSSTPKAPPAPATKTPANPKALDQTVQKLARRSPPAQVERQRPLASPAGASQAAGERGGTGGDAYRRVQAALRKALLPRFDYPMLARRRGWEGRVRIGVLVESDGDLRNIHVVESCGYRVLDEAALDDLREVGRLSEVNAWLDGEAISVILPIQYRLK